MATLSPERWREISPYLDQVLCLPEHERAAWLTAFRAARPELADLMSELLEEHRAAGQEHFLETGPAPNAAFLTGQTIGAYRLLSPIGQGGMGSVWLAERSDGRFERRVAVKFLRFSLAATGAARFKREGRILGQLSHPHIAELIDAGVTANGEPYLVLEHIDGEDIDKYCDEHRLDVRARLTLFLDVLSAVGHAHSNLIVHRDLKPSNVLVRHDGQVKLLDFGIAKLLADDATAGDATLLTGDGGGALTPQYAAPEQVTGGAITTATDVYALGVLLYLLLTGRHPTGTGQQSSAELIKAIVETEPLRASDVVRSSGFDKLHHLLSGDLDTILSKALKKNPRERYLSVVAFTDDIQRYLAHEPISARPDALGYRAAKFVRRNRLAVSLASAALFAVMAGLTGTLVQAHTARTQRDFAYRQLGRVEYVNQLNHFLLTDAAPSGKLITVDELLERAEGIVERENYEQSPADHVELLVSIGMQYCDRDEYNKALPILQKAYQLSRSLQDHSARAQASCSLANALIRQSLEESHSTQAEALIQEGLNELPDEPQFTTDRISCLLSGSAVADWGGDTRVALARAESAERVLDQSVFGSDYERLNVLRILSVVAQRGHHREAFAAYQRASLLMTSLGYDRTRTAADLFTSWGFALLNVGRTIEAENVIHRALDISREAQIEGETDQALLYANERALRELGDLKDATEFAERALAKARATKDDLIADQLLLEQARNYLLERNFPRSAALLAEAEPLVRRDYPAGDFMLATIVYDRSRLAEGTGDFPAALRLANEAVKLDEDCIKADRPGAHVLPGLLLHRSDLYLQAHDSGKARADAERALGLLQADAEPGTFSTYVGRAYVALGHALADQGKGEEARSAFRSAVAQLEHGLGADHAETLAARQMAGL